MTTDQHEQIVERQEDMLGLMRRAGWTVERIKLARVGVAALDVTDIHGYRYVGQLDLHGNFCGQSLFRWQKPEQQPVPEPNISCGFCHGQPVGNAQSWGDGKPRLPAPCPRCGQVNISAKGATSGS